MDVRTISSYIHFVGIYDEIAKGISWYRPVDNMLLRKRCLLHSSGIYIIFIILITIWSHEPIILLLLRFYYALINGFCPTRWQIFISHINFRHFYFQNMLIFLGLWIYIDIHQLILGFNLLILLWFKNQNRRCIFRSVLYFSFYTSLLI